MDGVYYSGRTKSSYRSGAGAVEGAHGAARAAGCFLAPACGWVSYRYVICPYISGPGHIARDIAKLRIIPPRTARVQICDMSLNFSLKWLIFACELTHTIVDTHI